MRIGINLATRPFADLGPALKRLRIAMGVLALAAICLGLGLRAIDKEAAEARARDQALDLQIARINHERLGYQAMMRQPQNAQVLAQVQTLNGIFDEKAFSWTLAMEDLETVLPGGVQVTSIEPTRDKSGRITLKLRVQGPRDRAIELVQNLEHSRHFLQPRIVGENSESNGGPGQQLEPVSAASRVNFDLLADYNPATARDRKPASEKDAAPAGSKAGSDSAAPVSEEAPGAHRPPYTGMARPKSPIKPRAGGPQ
jgi:type IV pilus assembly protein PilN